LSFRRFVLSSVALGAVSLLGTTSVSVAGECQLKQFASIPAAFTANGRIIVDVSLDNTPAKMLIDTGAGINMLGQAFVEERGLKVVESRGGVYGLTGKELHQMTRVSELRLGNAVARNPVFVVGALGSEGSNGGPVGIFGADYLAQYDVEIDPTGGFVKLFSPDHCPGNVVYWTNEYFRLPAHLTADHHLEAQIMVDGQELKAMIDTGAPMTTMRLATARDVFGIESVSPGGRAPGQISGVDGVKIEAFRHKFQSLTFGDITLHDTQMMIADIDAGKGAYDFGTRVMGNHTQADVIIGMSLLRQLHIFIAYSEPAIYFTVAEPKPGR
jgi:predicted aspartyl protease